MRAKRTAEFEKFDKTMSGLLAVPYSELQRKLEEEKHTKKEKEAAYFDRFFPLLHPVRSELLSATCPYRQGLFLLVRYR